MTSTSAGKYIFDSEKEFEYDVFLSFRGPDTRDFVDHLFDVLKTTRFKAFMDNDGLEHTKEIQQKLYEAIRRSKMSVVILSSNYADSRWCLDELVEIMELHASNVHDVLPVFFKVEPTVVRNQTGVYKDAFSKLEERYKGEKERVEKWKSALKRVAGLSGLSKIADSNSLLVEKIIQVLEKIFCTRRLYVPPYIVGRKKILEDINKWLQDGSTDVDVGLIYGLGGIGKSTIAKIAYNSNYRTFDGSSFLEDFTSRTASQSNGMACILEQVITDVTGRAPANKIYSKSKGILEVKSLLSSKRVLMVFDDVHELQYLAAFNDPNYFGNGSKIIITSKTRELRKVSLLKREFRVSELDRDDSKELLKVLVSNKNPLSQCQEELLDEFLPHCKGFPLALGLMGPVLLDGTEEWWKSKLEELEAYKDDELLGVFRLSYESLGDQSTKDLFLYVACFFIGMDKEYSVKILKGCELQRPETGLRNLVYRCLLTIDNGCKLMMHQTIEEMAKKIVYLEDTTNPGRRRILWSTEDSKLVLQENLGTSIIRGLRLYLPIPKPDNNTSSEPHNFETWPKRICLGLNFLNPRRRVSTSNLELINTSSFTMMSNLKLLLLNNVQLEGGYEDFPKKIKGLLWPGCPLRSLPSNFNLNELVVLDMQKSCLVHAWEACKYMGALRVLNLSYSDRLVCTPDLSCALKLECLFLEGCVSLVKVHESIGTLINLAHLNLKGCTNLAKMHRSIETLEKLTILNLAGCKSLASFPIPKNVQELNLAECSSFFMACNRTESSVICLSNPSTIISFTSSLLQYPVPSTSPFLPFNLYLPALKELNLEGCGISRVDVMGLLSCAPSLEILDLNRNPIRVFNYTDMRPTLKLKYLRELSLEGCGISGEDVLGLLLSCAPSLEFLSLKDNPIRALSNTDMRANLKLENILLCDCTELQSISWLPRRCHVFVRRCSSLKAVSYIPGSDPTSYITTDGCHELVEVDYGCSDRQVINWIDDLDESEANQLGFPNLVDIEDRSNRIARQGFYRAGTYQFCLLGDHLAKLFTETAIVRELHFTVPSNELDIRALNLGFMILLDKRFLHIQYDVKIKNLTSKWEWTLNMPSLTWLDKVRDGCFKVTLLTWASHWRTVKEHREIKPGDLLHISLDSSGFDHDMVTWGIKIIYDDQQQQQVDEDTSEQHDVDNVRQTDMSWSHKSIRRQTMNYIDKTTTCSIVRKRVDQEQEVDVSTSVSNNLYNNIFRSPLDLSVYERKRHSDDDEEEDLDHETRVYEIPHNIWS